jgi:ribosomal-protein-alanine N-acetyltransferase
MEKDDVYALVLKESGKVIGTLGIHDKSRDSYSTKIQREIGYVLAKQFWGQGLMSEAVTAAIRYAFEEIGVETLWCAHFLVNDRSRRVIEKTGFRFYGTGKYDATQLGKVFDDYVYRITRSDYFSESFEPFRK